VAAQILLVLSVVLMLGRHTPIYGWLFHTVPGFRMFRMPARWELVFLLAVSVLSAFGGDWLMKTEGRSWWARWWRTISIVVLGSAVALLVAGIAYIPIEKIMWTIDATEPRRLTLSWRDGLVLKPVFTLAITLAAVVLWRWMRPQWSGLVLAGVVALDLLVARPGFPLSAFSSAGDQSQQVLAQVGPRSPATTQPFRVDYAPNFVVPLAALGARVENVNGRWPMALRRFYRYVHWMRGLEADPIRRHQLLGHLYAADNPFPLRVLNVRWASKIDYRKRIGECVENPQPEPRAWVVDRAEVIADEEAILRRMRDPQFNPAAAVILESAPRITMASGDSPIGTCQVHKYENGDLDVDTNTTRDGYLVLSEVYYPGWRARIDGRDVPVERADYLITALPLPAGKHHVAYRYDPISFKVGAGCTAGSCLVGAVLLVRALKGRARRAG
jgi:hypothetical protein